MPPKDSRAATSRKVADIAGLRMARPAAPSKTTASSSTTTTTTATSTPFGVTRATATTNPTEFSSQWCGPFSVARRMIQSREEAKQQREEKLLAAASQPSTVTPTPLDNLVAEDEHRQQILLHPSLNWKPEFTAPTPTSRPTDLFSNRKRQFTTMTSSIHTILPTLATLCVNFLVTHFTAIESLGGLDSRSRNLISKALCDTGELSDAATRLIAGLNDTDLYYGAGGLPSLEIPDAANVTAAGLKQMVTTMFERDAVKHGVIIDHAGLAMDNSVAAVLLEPHNENRLDIFHITGAYVLTDAILATIITSNTASLQSLKLDVCPRVSLLAVASILTIDNLTELSLASAPAKVLAKLFEDKETLPMLRSLDLSSSVECSDAVIASVFGRGTGYRIEHLNLSNTGITDLSLQRIRAACGGALRSLEIDRCKEITNDGLVVFLKEEEELGEVIRLKRAIFSHCGNSSDAVNDEVVDLLCRNSSSVGLVTLDLSGGGQGVSDLSMESVVAHCKKTIASVDCSFCHKVTDKGVGYLVQECGGLKKLSVWGLAQLTDDFHDGHKRVGDGSFVVEGSWMKKTTGGVAGAVVADL